MNNNSRPCEIDDDELFALAEKHDQPDRLGSLYRREGGYNLLDLEAFEGGMLNGFSIRNRP